MCPRRPKRFQELKSSAHLRQSTTQMLRCTWRPCKRRCVCVCVRVRLQDVIPCPPSTSPLNAFIISLTFASLALMLMLGFLCRAESKSGSCWRRRRNETRSWSVHRRRRKRKLKRRQRNKYDVLNNTFRPDGYRKLHNNWCALIISAFSTFW